MCTVRQRLCGVCVCGLFRGNVNAAKYVFACVSDSCGNNLVSMYLLLFLRRGSCTTGG